MSQPNNFIDNGTVNSTGNALPSAKANVSGAPALPAATSLSSNDINTIMGALPDIKSVLGRTVSIMSYGADNTGATDCSAAFTSAIAALSAGGVLHLPGSGAVYRLSANRTVPKNVVLCFDSSYISVDTGVTLSILGEVVAPKTAQCFGGAGTTTINQGFRSVGWFGAIGDGSTDDTAAIQAAVNSVPQNQTSNHSPCRLFFPAAPLGYKVSSTLNFVDVANLFIEFEAPVILEQTGTSFQRHQLQWYGNATSAVVQFSEFADGMRIDSMSINGQASTNHALYGIAFSVGGASGNDPAKFIITNQLNVANCRFGILIGGDSADLDDTTNMVHNQTLVTNCLDVGIVVNSGNAGGVLFSAPALVSNGGSPTNDAASTAIGVDGNGCNFMEVSGQVTLLEGVSVGHPATCGIFVGQDINLSSWWSEDFGVGLIISGNATYTRHVNITGFRHYNGSFFDQSITSWIASTGYTAGNRVSNGLNVYQCITSGTSASSGGPTGTGSNITDNTAHWEYVDTLADIEAYGGQTGIPVSCTSSANGAVFSSCYWFGNVQLVTGENGCAVALGNQFYSGAQRPNLGQGGWTGAGVTTYASLISLGNRGNAAGLLGGGGGTRVMGPSSPISNALVSAVGVALAECLGANAGSSGYSLGPANVEDALGSFEIMLNCYQDGTGSGTYLAYTVGMGYRLTVGGGQLVLNSYNFADTVTPVGYAAFAEVAEPWHSTISGLTPSDGFAAVTAQAVYNSAPTPGSSMGVVFTTGGVVSAVAWQSSHSYSGLGAIVNNGGNVYQLITTGTSASSGGPTGTGSNITDGSCHWTYLGVLAVYKQFGPISS